MSGTSGGVVGLNSVQGTCGEFEVVGTEGYQVTIRPNGTLGPYGAVGTPTKVATRLGTATGAAFPARHCPAGAIAAGILGGTGLNCAKPVAR